METGATMTTNYKRMAWFALGFNVLVVVGGAIVKATGSGAGCGEHWPICNGEVIPRPQQIETVIEFTHRATSGLALLIVAAMVVWARRVTRPGDRVRRAAHWSLGFLIFESLLGALLVLGGWTAMNVSWWRVALQPIHFINTMILLMFLLLHAWWATVATPVQWANRPSGFWWRFGVAAVLLMLVNGTGSIISLGDLLIRELGEDSSGLVQLMYQMRPGHPAIAIGAGAIVVWLTFEKSLSPSASARRWAWATAIFVVAQWGVGLLNVVMNVPLWTAMLHLLLADAAWLSLGLWFVTAIERPEPAPSPVPADTVGRIASAD